MALSTKCSYSGDHGNGTDINVVAGHTATLPCDTTHAHISSRSREQPSLILWFRENESKPIFR